MSGRPDIAANLAWNLSGEVLPALAAMVAIPMLVHRLGAERFGVLTLSWMLAGYFALFDFGLGRALTQALTQAWSLGDRATAAALFWTGLAMMLIFSALAAGTFALLAPWLVRRALKIPVALQGETLLGFYLIACGLPMLISTSALRAALSAADRFDLLNLIRTPVGILSFAAPAMMLPFTHSLAWLIAALVLNRVASFAVYFAAILRSLPDLRSHLGIDLRCALPLLGFGAWVTVSSAIVPILVYLDRFFIGALLSISALTAYSVPMEIVSKSFIFPAAVSGVMFPAFTRSLAGVRASARTQFARSLGLVAVTLCPICAAVVAFAPQIMSMWIDGGFALQSSVVLQILAVGAFITGLAWIPLALLHGAHRPDLPAKLHLLDFPVYALLLWIGIGKFGLAGAACVWSARMLVENLVLFAMASRIIEVPTRTVVGGCAALAVAIATVAAGAFIGPIYIKIAFVAVLPMIAAIATWRFLLEARSRTRIMERLPALFGPVLEKAAER